MTDFAARRRTMVDTQIRPSDVTKFPIIDAMLSVPREIFVPPQLREVAYADEMLPLGGGRVMLDPRTLARMLDALDVQRKDLVLDVGCGLGYSAAVVARLAEAVVAVEEDPQMAAEAQANLSQTGIDNAAVIEGPLAEGDAKHGPYDVIIIEGAIEQLPAKLADQLREGGKVAAIFMEGVLGVCRIGYKIEGTITWRYGFSASAPVLPGFERQRDFVL